MNTKLTLTIEKSVIEKAKVFARQSGRSLSDLVESYLENLVSEEEVDQSEVPEAFKDLFGCVNLPADMDEKAAIRSILAEKHRE